MFNKPCVSFSGREMRITTITSVSVLSLLTCRLIVFGLEMTKWHSTHATTRVSAQQGARRARNNVCVSVIHFPVLRLSYSCEEEDRPHLIQTGRLKELGGGKGAATGFFLHSVTCPPCTLCYNRLSLLQCCWRHDEHSEHHIWPHIQTCCTNGIGQLCQWWGASFVDWCLLIDVRSYKV